MSMLRHFMILVLIVAPLASCTTYEQTKAKLQTGYYEDLKLEAERDAELAKDEHVALERDVAAAQDEQVAVKRDIATTEQQLAAIETDLKAASKNLDRVLNENRVSRQEYERLKQELDRLTLEQQTQSFAHDSAEKQRKIDELRKKKEALEKSIQALATS